jgi:hypothetical protein
MLFKQRIVHRLRQGRTLAHGNGKMLPGKALPYHREAAPARILVGVQFAQHQQIDLTLLQRGDRLVARIVENQVLFGQGARLDQAGAQPARIQAASLGLPIPFALAIRRSPCLTL